MTTRIRLFRWITKGLREGFVLPWWAIAARACLFPLETIGCSFYDPLRDVYTIRGKQFSGVFFDALAAVNDKAVYQITCSSGSGLVTVHRYQLPLDSDALADLQQ